MTSKIFKQNAVFRTFSMNFVVRTCELDSMRSKASGGFGLLGAMVMIAVAAIIVGVIAKTSALNAKSAAKTKSKAELSTIRAHLFQNVSCPETFKASLGFSPQGNPCPTGSYIAIRSASSILIDADGSTLIDKWNLMAYCHVNGVEIRAVSLKTPFRNNLEDKKWIGKMVPDNNDHYLKDELLGSYYSWQNPVSVIVKPGSDGLCANWFGSTAPIACSGYLEDENIGDESDTCKTTPNCTAPLSLTFNSFTNEFECTNAQYQNLINQYSTIINNHSAQMISAATNSRNGFMNRLDNVNNQINALGFNNSFVSVYGDDFVECATLNHMKCPPGYAVKGYEALMPTAGNRCRLECQRIRP